MKKIPTLFKKDKTGKIVSWTMEISGDKYRTISGKLDGKLVTSAWTTALPKNVGRANATTGVEQAEKEVWAKVTKKLEENYFESLDDADNANSQEQEVVMLAEQYEDFCSTIDDDEIIYVQPKLDGIRARDLKTEMVSRKNKIFYTVPHILEELQLFDIGLDGELYNHDLKSDFNSIVSLVKQSKVSEADLVKSKEIIQYHVYDCIIPNVKFSDRLKYLQNLFFTNDFTYLKLVPTYAIVKKEIEHYHTLFVELGYEGIIIRRDANYEFFRSKNLLKLKSFKDAEYEIVDVIEGVGNRAGMMGKFLLKTSSGKQFYANAKGSFDYYKQLLQDKVNLIGKQATVKYQNITPDGVPRFGIIHSIRDYE